MVLVDDYYVEFVVNIGISEDVKGVLENGGEGVGFYCIEFLYMGCEDFLMEEE